MKIKSVKIFGDSFKSLKADYLYEFNNSVRTDRLATKIFAGLNGSGKSNFLELFSEIFYFLELFHLPTPSQNYKANKNFGFEINYYLLIDRKVNLIILKELETKFRDKKGEIRIKKNTTFKDAYKKGINVRIIKNLESKPEFSISINEKDYTRISNPDITNKLLPTKVIAYTSGQNELLSNPFYKLKYHYFSSIEDKRNDNIDISKMFFLDYSSNFSIFIANMLLSDTKKLKSFKKVLELDDINSFRITINLNDYNGNPIVISSAKLKTNINNLEQCATTWINEKKGKRNTLILDYKVNSETKKAFRYYFKSAINLFSVFYELDRLNLHLINKKTRKTTLEQNRHFNISDEMPKVDPSSLVFRIEKINIEKIIDVENNVTKGIYYKALSDGEHQFNEVIGSVLMMDEPNCLFLMDEPDTHFNPKWRGKMISILNKMSAIAMDSKENISKVRNQEVILTTHSPFVISDSYKEDVYKFDKGTYKNPEIETYGASVSLLLKLIFDRDISISDFSNEELFKLKQSIKDNNDIENVKDQLLNFGESIEKFDAYSYLRIKDKEFNLEKK